MASHTMSTHTPSKKKLSSGNVDKKLGTAPVSDRIVMDRIAYLWSASQAALTTGNAFLSGFYLYALSSFLLRD